MAELVLLTPLWVECRAVGHGAVRTGMGRGLRAPVHGPAAVVGLCGALKPDLAPGTVIVATEVRDEAGVAVPTTEPAALAAALGARTGPVLTVPRVVHGAERARLAATGACAVDMESAVVLAGVHGPRAVVRVVVDTPRFPLLHPKTVPSGVVALRRLRTLVPGLRDWALRVGSPTSDMEV